ncbi:hypothetical protein JCM11641_008405 [Rhodosporidiobolus odoratus]
MKRLFVDTTQLRLIQKPHSVSPTSYSPDFSSVSSRRPTQVAILDSPIAHPSIQDANVHIEQRCASATGLSLERDQAAKEAALLSSVERPDGFVADRKRESVDELVSLCLACTAGHEANKDVEEKLKDLLVKKSEKDKARAKAGLVGLEAAAKGGEGKKDKAIAVIGRELGRELEDPKDRMKQEAVEKEERTTETLPLPASHSRSRSARFDEAPTPQHHLSSDGIEDDTPSGLTSGVTSGLSSPLSGLAAATVASAPSSLEQVSTLKASPMKEKKAEKDEEQHATEESGVDETTTGKPEEEEKALSLAPTVSHTSDEDAPGFVSAPTHPDTVSKIPFSTLPSRPSISLPRRMPVDAIHKPLTASISPVGSPRPSRSREGSAEERLERIMPTGVRISGKSQQNEEEKAMAMAEEDEDKEVKERVGGETKYAEQVHKEEVPEGAEEKQQEEAQLEAVEAVDTQGTEAQPVTSSASSETVLQTPEGEISPRNSVESLDNLPREQTLPRFGKGEAPFAPTPSPVVVRKEGYEEDEAESTALPLSDFFTPPTCPSTSPALSIPSTAHLSSASSAPEATTTSTSPSRLSPENARHPSLPLPSTDSSFAPVSPVTTLTSPDMRHKSSSGDWSSQGGPPSPDLARGSVQVHSAHGASGSGFETEPKPEDLKEAKKRKERERKKKQKARRKANASAEAEAEVQAGLERTVGATEKPSEADLYRLQPGQSGSTTSELHVKAALPLKEKSVGTDEEELKAEEYGTEEYGTEERANDAQPEEEKISTSIDAAESLDTLPQEHTHSRTAIGEAPFGLISSSAVWRVDVDKEKEQGTKFGAEDEIRPNGASPIAVLEWNTSNNASSSLSTSSSFLSASATSFPSLSPTPPPSRRHSSGSKSPSLSTTSKGSSDTNTYNPYRGYTVVSAFKEGVVVEYLALCSRNFLAPSIGLAPQLVLVIWQTHWEDVPALKETKPLPRRLIQFFMVYEVCQASSITVGTLLGLSGISLGSLNWQLCIVELGICIIFLISLRFCGIPFPGALAVILFFECFANLFVRFN